MVKIGDIVYDAGDCWSAVMPIKVTEDNISIISEYWNGLFFSTMEEAEHKNNIMHSIYGEYQESVIGLKINDTFASETGYRKENNMGYESKLYVVEKTAMSDENHMFYGIVVAMFDLSKVYYVSDRIKKYPYTNTVFFSDDGNTEIIEDIYGERLREIPLKDMITILREASANSDYRRYKPALALLESFDDPQWKDIVVLHYGH